MNKKALSARLDDYAGEAVPAGIDLWPRLAAQLGRMGASLRPRSPQRQRSAQSRAAVLRAAVAGVLLAAVALGALVAGQLVGPAGTNTTPAPPGAALSGEQWREQADLEHNGMAYVARYGTTLNVSRTEGGYAVVLHAAYADANEVAVVLSIAGPAGAGLAPAATMLTDRGAAGSRLLPLFGYRSAAQAPIYTLLFNMPAGSRQPGPLDLRLDLRLARPGTDQAMPGLFPQADLQDTWLIRGGEVTPAAAAWAGGDPLGGDFAFDILLPVTSAGTTAAIYNHTETAASQPITLEQVIASPGQTRAILRYAPSDGAAPWLPDLDLQNADLPPAAPPNSQATAVFRRLAPDRWSYSIFPPPEGDTGNWILTIRRLRGGSGSSQDPSLPGPWTFKYILPAPN